MATGDILGLSIKELNNLNAACKGKSTPVVGSFEVLAWALYLKMRQRLGGSSEFRAGLEPGIRSDFKQRLRSEVKVEPGRS